MTRALLCDGCGGLVSERSEAGDDATASWFRLELDPGLTASTLLATLELDVGDALDQDHHDEPEPGPIPPPWHFCSAGCLVAWVRRLPDTPDGLRDLFGRDVR